MLFLTKSDYEKMLAHCKKGLPNEACGLIGGVGRGKTVCEKGLSPDKHG